MVVGLSHVCLLDAQQGHVYGLAASDAALVDQVLVEGVRFARAACPAKLSNT